MFQIVIMTCNCDNSHIKRFRRMCKIFFLSCITKPRINKNIFWRKPYSESRNGSNGGHKRGRLMTATHEYRMLPGLLRSFSNRDSRAESPDTHINMNGDTALLKRN